MAEPPVPPVDSIEPDYAVLSAPVLLHFLQRARRDREHPQAQGIFSAFYHRYSRYVAYLADRRTLGGGEADTTALVHDTFLRFFEVCDRFTCEDPNPLGFDRNLRAYLGRIAKNLVLDRFRARARSVPIVAVEQDVFEAVASDDNSLTEPPAPEPPSFTVLNDYTAKLRPLERDVLHAYYLDDHLGQKSSRLPDGVAEALAARHGTTTANLRQIKRKLLRDLRALFPRE